MASLAHMDQRNTARLATQDVNRKAVGKILFSSQYSQVVVPVFQRGYCWEEPQLEGWWKAVIKGTESIAEGDIKLDLAEEIKKEEESESVKDFHSCGIGRFRLNQDSLVCVDGQQRLTTTSLLVAAIRDKLKGLAEVDLCREANQLLVSDVDFLEKAGDTSKSTIQSKLRLLPSQPDRKEFIEAVLGKRTGGSGHISQALSYFSNQLSFLLETLPKKERAKMLLMVLQSSLLWMRMMAVEVRSDLSVCQWFLWLQEKTLFGFAALLMNNNPGIVFDAWDLAKNLLLSAFMERGLDEQEEILNQKWWRWVSPLMARQVNLDQLLSAFLDSREDGKRYIGKYERSILDIVKATSEEESDDEDETVEDSESTREERKPDGKEKFSGVLLYSRFQSYCEGQAMLEPSQKPEAINTSIIAELEEFSQSFT